MATCIINSKSNHVFILYEELIDTGVILIFDHHENFLFSKNIIHNNSAEFDLPHIGGSFTIINYYKDVKIKKDIFINHKEIEK